MSEEISRPPGLKTRIVTSAPALNPACPGSGKAGPAWGNYGCGRRFRPGDSPHLHPLLPVGKPGAVGNDGLGKGGSDIPRRIKQNRSARRAGKALFNCEPLFFHCNHPF